MILQIIGYFKEINNDGKICQNQNELGIHPNLFYEWQSKFLKNGELAFAVNKEKKALEKQVVKLTSKSDYKDKVMRPKNDCIKEFYGVQK